MKVITFGSFDVFHVGHLHILQRAREFGDYLLVGVSSDSLHFSKKKRAPFYSHSERMEIISALSCVDKVFLEESLELKRQYIIKYNADILIMGDDWDGKFDKFGDICQVVYLPRTPAISTTAVIEKIRMPLAE